MTVCQKCSGTKFRINTVYQYYDIFECLNCDTWTYKRHNECCRDPLTRVVMNRKNHSQYFLRKQCIQCGGCINMSKPLNSKLYMDSISGDFNTEAFNLWKKNRQEEGQILYEAKKISNFLNSKYYKYLEYLASDAWKQKRVLVLKRDLGLCQKCKTNPAREIHHIKYDNLFNEPLDDLISFCKACHIAEHKSPEEINKS